MSKRTHDNAGNAKEMTHGKNHKGTLIVTMLCFLLLCVYVLPFPVVVFLWLLIVVIFVLLLGFGIVITMGFGAIFVGVFEALLTPRRKKLKKQREESRKVESTGTSADD